MTVQWRLSNVGFLKVNQTLFASVIQVGDNDISQLFSRVIAVQRMIPNFYRDETRFAAYPIFFRPLLELRAEPEGSLFSRSRGAEIRVDTVKVLTHNASSLIRIGSSHAVVAESRIKHIRQFNAGPPMTPPEYAQKGT